MVGGFIGGIGSVGVGFMQGLDMAATLRDRATELKIKQLKLDNDKIDALAEAAAFKGLVGGQGGQGGGQPGPYAAPGGQQQPQGPQGNVSGLPPGQPPPGSVGMPTIMNAFAGSQPGTPQPSPPGTPSAPGGGQPQQPQVPPRPYDAPQGPQQQQQFDPAAEIQRYAQQIKQANPGIDDRTAYHATLKAIAASRELAPETRIFAQAQLEAIRQSALTQRQEEKIAADAAKLEKADTDRAALAKDRDAATAERDAAKADAAAARQSAGDQAKMARAQLAHKDRLLKIDAGLQTAQRVDQRIRALAGQANVDKVKLQAQMQAHRDVVAKMNAAQRVMNGIMLAKPGADPETDPQYKAAINTYEQAQQKLDLLEKSLPPEQQQGGNVVDFNSLK